MSDAEKYIYELRQAVSWASRNYEIWWVYKSKDTRPLIVNVMNRYIGFFETSIHAHFVAVLTSLYRLYETRKDTYNIPRFLIIIKENNSIPAEKLDELERYYEEIKPLWKKIGILRNEVFSHRSLESDVSGAFKKAGLKPIDLKEVIDKTQYLLNELSLKYNGSSHAFNNESREDTLRMFEDLSRSMKS